MTEATASRRLAARFSRFGLDDIPEGSREAVKRLLLDYLGVALAGSQSESGEVARKFGREHGGQPQARLVGDGSQVDITVAAFVNAICSHSLELDDIDVLALFHFSPPVYSAALASAEYAGADGRSLLTALAAGCEMMERGSRAMNLSLRNRGFHTTPVCGSFGATIASAKLLGLDEEQMVSALGLAGAQASGLMEMYGPSMQKRFTPGPAARNGVTAARMAQLGFTGTDTIFEGERGVLSAFTDESQVDRLLAEVDAPYELLIEFKPYSAARPIHNGIDCALQVRRQDGFAVDEIESIEIARHPDWADYHLNPGPRTLHEAQVSLPFSVAVALIDGAALPEQYGDQNINDPKVRHLSEMAKITTDPSLPRGVSCKMTVTQRGGRTFTQQVDDPKGSIGNPMSNDELRAKFLRLGGPVIGEQRANQLADQVMNLEDVPSVSGLLELTAK